MRGENPRLQPWVAQGYVLQTRSHSLSFLRFLEVQSLDIINSHGLSRVDKGIRNVDRVIRVAPVGYGMADVNAQICPYCEEEVALEWGEVAETEGTDAKQLSCPECGRILAVTELFD